MDKRRNKYKENEFGRKKGGDMRVAEMVGKIREGYGGIRLKDENDIVVGIHLETTAIRSCA